MGLGDDVFETTSSSMSDDEDKPYNNDIEMDNHETNGNDTLDIIDEHEVQDEDKYPPERERNRESYHEDDEVQRIEYIKVIFFIFVSICHTLDIFILLFIILVFVWALNIHLYIFCT